MQNTAEKKERAALAGLAAANMDERERSTEISMAELAALVETAGGEAVVSVLQNKQSPDPRTFLGEGKVAELKACIEANECDLAVFDNELSPSQMRVLSEELGGACSTARVSFSISSPSAPRRRRASCRWSSRSITICSRA